MPMIEVRGLRKAYGEKVVVDGVSFTVDEGEIFGILGPNGAGKTTTVECVEGLRTPDAGTVRVGGLDLGATGYLLKDAPREELFAAVRAAAEGRTVLSPAVASRLVSRVRTPAAPVDESLSAREREVLELVAKGTSNRAIAVELFISEATVKTHLTHIYAKLGVKDRAAAVAVAYERGILGRA
ncbi:LuxR C-terminal-related transcriptional regulator [Streptomyces sp. NPDC048370]|uniref:LuxR C-terminal-related transcriptional regulator n=1 Tax=Streptomyces sp. NPDC048370 TaxID=3365540 RepID=UPI00371C516C